MLGSEGCQASLESCKRESFAAPNQLYSTRRLELVEGEIMGREENRLRERSIIQLTKRLRRTPTEEEIEKDVAGQLEAQGLASQQGRGATRSPAPKPSRRPR